MNDIRKQFPQLQNTNVVFFDTAASALKPQCVIDAVVDAMSNHYANVHRGGYEWASQITTEFEEARKSAQKFINAKSDKEIIFTRNATEGVNLLASCLGLNKDDEVLVSKYEHHANLVPWQQFDIKIFDENNIEDLISDKTKIVAITAMSNVLGYVPEIKKIIKIAHDNGAKVVLDVCQYIVHHKVDVQEFDVDFIVFSGHKIYGPTGVGVLYGREDLLNQLSPYQYGGDMVENVSYETSTFKKAPVRFEAGTPAIVEVIGLKSAIEFMQTINFEKEKEISDYLKVKLLEIDGLKLFGDNGVFCFDLCGIHASDVAFMLNKYNVCVRIGHHCAQPLVNSLGYNSLARASVGVYTTKKDVDLFVEALIKVKKFF